MIKMLNAYTAEIDEPALAVSDILRQLDIENKLLKNTVGIICAYHEFAESGVLAAISEALPFDVVGFTSAGTATNGSFGELLLTISVLTSDDAVFSANISNSITEENISSEMSALYKKLSNKLGSAPKLLMPFVPIMFNIGADEFVEELDAACDNTPMFGTVNSTLTPDMSDAAITYNAQIKADALAMIAISGEVDYSFHRTLIYRTLKQKAIITDSEGPVIKEINDMPAVEYLESIGLIKDRKIGANTSIPLIIDLKDGTVPIVRGMLSLDAKRGYVMCAGSVPPDSSLAIGLTDFDDILNTADKILEEILEEKGGCAIMYSCMGRNIALGSDTLAEMRKTDETAKGKLAYQFSYSGGEICPVLNKKGDYANRHHNSTLVACVLK